MYTLAHTSSKANYVYTETQILPCPTKTNRKESQGLYAFVTKEGSKEKNIYYKDINNGLCMK